MALIKEKEKERPNRKRSKVRLILRRQPKKIMQGTAEIRIRRRTEM
jgi:hypothetical protein